MSEQYWQLVEQEIERAMDALFPHGAGRAASDTLVRHMLERVARKAYQNGESAALLTLLTLDDALEQVNAWLHEQRQRPISRRRLAAIAQNRHQRFGVGWQVPGTGQWLFRPDEVKALRPALQYRREAVEERNDATR